MQPEQLQQQELPKKEQSMTKVLGRLTKVELFQIMKDYSIPQKTNEHKQNIIERIAKILLDKNISSSTFKKKKV
jgi:hypothetical protein